LDRKAGRGILEIEGEVYKRTSVSSTRFRQKKRIEVDVSDYATEEILSMKCKDGKWRLIAFLSKSLNETEL